MVERRILEKINHPFLIKMHWAFQSVILIDLSNIETLSSLCAGLLPWRGVILSPLEISKIPRKGC